jgi:transcriptional regulator with XRE-family HTH domain
MSELDEIRIELGDRNLSEVARRTGIHWNTLYSIYNGRNKNPTPATIEKLAHYLGIGQEGARNGRHN